MIVVKNVVEKANVLITAGGLTKDQIDQLIAAEKFLDDASVLSVATVRALPSAANNRGRIYYVTAEQRYYFSDGTIWRKDFTSKYEVKSSIAYGWGYNTGGVLGDGTTSSRSSPVTVIGGIITWNQISTGKAHVLALTSAGIAYAWGLGADGRLGDSTTASKISPVTVVGGITNWKQLSAGDRHSLGVTTSGIAYAWGRNSLYGRLGDGTIADKSSPIIVAGGITNWNQISAGGNHSIGLTSTGIVYAWGRNQYGQLGDNTTSIRLTPVTVIGGITSWNAVAAGYNHNLGTISTGVAYAWGFNTSGQLGDNTATTRSSPVTVVGGITNWSLISGGSSSHSLGVISTGIAYSWGANSTGQLGDNTTSARASPVTVVGGVTNWSQVDAGDFHSVGLTTSGVAYAWGRNNNGQLGDNTTSNRASPVTVVGGITNWSQISAGGQSSSAINVAAEVTKGFL